MAKPAKRGRNSSSEFAPSLLGHAHHAPDSAPPARRYVRVIAIAMSVVGVSLDSSVRSKWTAESLPSAG